MSRVEARRRVRVGWIALGVLGVLFVFELVMICGVIELRGGTVARVAPWAYEPFLRLVGEHPDQLAAMPANEAEPKAGASAMDIFGGLGADGIHIDLRDDAVVEPVVEEASGVDDAVERGRDEVVPVG